MQRAPRILAIAASAGGIEAIGQLLQGLPEGFPAPVVIVQHLDPHHASVIDTVLGRHSRLPLKLAETGDRLQPGHVYVAPPDHHLVVHPDGRLELTQTESVSFVRPSADVLFSSVAEAFGEGATAVVLSGTGHDGAEGVRAIREHGGAVIAQDAETAQFRGMPLAAIETGCVDFVVPIALIAARVIMLADGTPA